MQKDTVAHTYIYTHTDHPINTHAHTHACKSVQLTESKETNKQSMLTKGGIHTYPVTQDPHTSSTQTESVKV